MPCSNLLMVHGVQGTLNHLEPPSGSEPLTTAGGDGLDPVVAQEEGEHNAGSREDGTGGDDHDVEVAVVEDTADDKKITIHSDGAEDAAQPIGSSGLESGPSTLDADEKFEAIPNGEIDSTTLQQEDEKTNYHSEDARPPQLDITLDHGAEPSLSEDNGSPGDEEGKGEVGLQDQPAASASETVHLPATTTEDELAKQMLSPFPDVHVQDSTVAPAESLSAQSPQVDPPLSADISDVHSLGSTIDWDRIKPKSKTMSEPGIPDKPQSPPTVAEDVEGFSAAQDQPFTEASEVKQDEQVELQDTLTGSPVASGDTRHEDNDLADAKIEDTVEHESLHDPEIPAPALIDVDNSSITQGLLSSQDEDEAEAKDKPVESQTTRNDSPLETETVDAQATADEPITDSSDTGYDSEPPSEPPSTSLKKAPSSEDVRDVEQQPSGSIEMISAATHDETQCATSEVGEQAEEVALETGSEPSEETVGEDSAPLEASGSEKIAENASAAGPAPADVVEEPEQALSNSSADHQESESPEPSLLDATIPKDLHIERIETTGNQEDVTDPAPSLATDEALPQAEAEGKSTENASEHAENICSPEGQVAEEPIQIDDAHTGLVDPGPVDSGEPFPAPEYSETTPPESPSVDQDDSGINLEPCIDAVVPESGPRDVEEAATESTEPAQSKQIEDKGLEEGLEAELYEVSGDSDTLRDSGISMKQSDDNLSVVTVKAEPTLEVSDAIETDTKDTHDEDHEPLEVLKAHSSEVDVSLQKDHGDIFVHSEVPGDIEVGNHGPAHPTEVAESEPTIASPAEEDIKSSQDESASQEQVLSEAPQPGDYLLDSKSEKDGDDHQQDAVAGTSAAAALIIAAGVASRKIPTSDEHEAQASPEPQDSVDSERLCTADKATDSDGTAPSTEPSADETIVPQESAPATSATIEAGVPSESQQDEALDRDFTPRASRRDSSTQTEELWRPKTPFMRSATPAIVLPDTGDSEAKIKSRAGVSRTASRRSIQQAEEVVAAAVIIRAAADTLGQTSTRMADAVKDMKQHEIADVALSEKDGRRGTGDAARSLRDSSANRLTGVDRTPKSEEKPPRTPRHHRSSHGSRSSGPSTRDSGGKRHSSHRHRHDGDRELEQGSPQTPPRTRDTADSGHRTRKERTPQEQADHDKRKEERRLAREKAKTDSPAAESKGKEVDAPPSIDRRSSRRHSSTRKENVPSTASTSRTESTAPPQTSKRFFDKNGTSVMEGFGGPLTAEASKDGYLKRSSSKTVRRSLSQSQAKLHKARAEESVKASKDKDGKDKNEKERPRESRTISSTTSNGTASTKDRDDKHRKSRTEKREKEDAANGHKEKKSGGLKGMFKKLFG